MVVIEQSAKFYPECGTCHRDCDGWVVQLVRDGRLRWEAEWVCGNCGYIVDDDGWGPAPEGIREILLNQYGFGCIQVYAYADHGGKLLKAFRDSFGYSIQEAKGAAQDLTSAGWRGTQVEAAFISKILRGSGIEVGACA
ncbi:hypothetical protein [Streptomyces sp. NPDC058382]|uniref:hypothetical protein n=1 Tax=unclassified Streptomyces TaxID=2593676 RepID=UPI00362765F9